MKRTKILALLFALLIALPGFAFKLGGKDLSRAGTGKRSKWFMTIYYASLYVPAELKGQSGKAILEADQPMSVIMKIDTRMLSREKFVKAVRDGFKKAKKAGYPTNKVNSFLNLFNNLTIKKYDKIYLHYIPKSGVIAKYKSKATGKTKTLGTTPGLAFKKALYAIWIGPNPVQSGLKKKMLGK